MTWCSAEGRIAMEYPGNAEDCYSSLGALRAERIKAKIPIDRTGWAEDAMRPVSAIARRNGLSAAAAEIILNIC